MANRMTAGFLRDEDTGALVTTGGAAGGGNTRTLLWDAGASAYDHAEWWTDTANPRVFIGPAAANPAGIGAIVGPVFGDQFLPTEEPV